jgi:SSS family transporter
LIMGIATTTYTTLGGMRAVIWTDVIQFSFLLSGVLAISWLSISRIPGGLHAVLVVAGQAGHLRLFNFSFDPHQLAGFWPATLGGGAIALATLGTDQNYLQRYFSTRSLRQGQLSILMDAAIIVPISLLLFLVGPVLYTFYRFYPSHLQGLPTTDAILPFFVIHELRGILSGVIIASIFAASMAVMSAGLNSLTTATTVDFYKGWLRPNLDERHYVLIGRCGTVAWGITTTAAALFANRLGPLVNAFAEIIALLGGPVLGMFLLGMLTRRAKSTASVVGGGLGLTVVVWLALTSDISFFYHALIGTVITFAAGYLLSLWGPRPDPTRLVGLVVGLGSSDLKSEYSPGAPVDTMG